MPEVISNNLRACSPTACATHRHATSSSRPRGKSRTRKCAWARSKAARFTYEEVDEYLADRAAWKSKLTPQVHKLLADMHELAMILRKRRFARGALELLDARSPRDACARWQVSGAVATVNTESHQIIESSCSRPTKRSRGCSLTRLAVPAPRPRQARPRRLKQLTEFVQELGIECESLESRFELQRVLPRSRG